MGDPKIQDAMFRALAEVAVQVATTCQSGKQMMQGVKSTPPSSPRNPQPVSVKEQRRLAGEQYRASNKCPSNVIPFAL